MGRYQHCLVGDLLHAGNPSCKRRIKLGDKVLCRVADYVSYSDTFNPTGVIGEVVGFGPGPSSSIGDEGSRTVRFDSEVGGWNPDSHSWTTRDPADTPRDWYVNGVWSSVLDEVDSVDALRWSMLWHRPPEPIPEWRDDTEGLL